MTAQILDGAQLAKDMRQDIAQQAQRLTASGHQPGLAVVLVGEDPASQVYVRNKVDACQKAGFLSVMHRLPATTTESELLAMVQQLNQDPSIHGILVQLPLPKHIDSHRVIETIAPDKDVDGFHISNAGLLMTGTPLFRPCTPYGVMKLLEKAGVSLRGAEAVVIGASNIVGKPQAMLLLQAGATVTVCNSKTRDLAAHCRRADVLVVAVGRPNMITGDMIKPGAVVIDVGINRLDNGKLCGDVDFESARQVAGWITPVPGGVGPMTITMLLQNTLEAVERIALARNPLLDFSGLPRFGDIVPEHVTPAIEHLLAKANAAFESVTRSTTPATWADVVTPMDDANEHLARAWGVVSHLHSVMDSPALRDAYNANLPKITEFWTRIGQDEQLHAKYKAIAAGSELASAGPVRQRVIANALRDFRLGGAELPAERKPRFADIQERLAALSARFSENVLDSTNAFSHLETDLSRLSGLPDDALEAAREAAEREGQTGYKFTLQFPSYFPVLQYADNRELRRTLYDASAKRASEFGNSEWDNTSLMREILQLRAEEAELLGFSNYAEVSLVPKMADSPAMVMDFLRQLATRARPHAEKDLAEVRQFAREKLGLDTLEPWDMAYASEKLRQDRYAFSDNEVRQYFQEPAVLKGLFDLTQTLFSVQIREEDAPKWHPDVRFFTVYRDSSAIAHFYLDPYARDQKRGGAWMDDARGRKRRSTGELQTPVAYLTCNFPSPVGGRPATLTHDDVLTLFHEFGHGLHHMLTRIEEPAVAGISGVEWDAVELPSQFMENFGWEWHVLSKMTSHIETSKALPKALFDKMVAAKNFQSGLQTLRQIEFALFDMRLHCEFEPSGEQSILELLEEVRDEIAVVRPPAYNRFPNTFSHIFAGGYSAGYYSYKWAEVLSADAYAQFEETGVLNASTGQKFLDEILSVGGSRPAAQSFRAFRGRDPKLDALLRHSGMGEPTDTQTA